MNKIEMSEEAILRRLKTVDELRTLCLSLMKAKKESDEKNKNNENGAEMKKSPDAAFQKLYEK